MISFFVPGKAMPAGSKRPITLPGRDFTTLIDMSKNKPWKRDVQKVARLAWTRPASARAFKFSVEFIRPRPKNHFFRDGRLRPGVPRRPLTKPDTLKLMRCIEDALTGIVWLDDSQVVIQAQEKLYSNHADRRDIGAKVFVEEIEN